MIRIEIRAAFEHNSRQRKERRSIYELNETVTDSE